MTQLEFRELAKAHGLKLDESCHLTWVEDENGQRVSIQDLTLAQFHKLLGL